MKILFIILICFFIPVSFAAQLSPIESQIRTTIRDQTSTQIKLLETLVNINSGTSNLKGVKKVGELLRPEFNQLGFKTYWVEEPSSLHRAGTLIAERQGNKGKRLLLIGHLDTVFPSDSPFQHFELSKDSAKGPGVCDDKGGLVVLLYALKALNTVHALDNTTMTIVLTGDEEDSGKPTTISRKPLVDIAKDKEVALDFEPTITLNTSTIARRGVSHWRIEVQGNESHSATIFQKGVGVGAIFGLSNILESMRIQLMHIKYLSFNPGIILGGTKADYDQSNSQATVFGKQNVVAKVAIAAGDFRYLSMEQKQFFETRMEKIVKIHLPGTSATISFQDGIPAMPPTANNQALLNIYSKVSEDLGQGEIKPFNPGLRGAGDISYIASIVPANLSGLGPEGFGTHTVIEKIELNSLPIQTERAALLIYRLTN